MKLVTLAALAGLTLAPLPAFAFGDGAKQADFIATQLQRCDSNVQHFGCFNGSAPAETTATVTRPAAPQTNDWPARATAPARKPVRTR